MVGPSAKRTVLQYLEQRYTCGVSLICRTICWNRSGAYRKSIKDDSEVISKLTSYAEQYPTRGFDWYYLKIRAEGLTWNRKRVLRVYRLMNLKLRRKHKKRINRTYTEGLSQPIQPNVTWSMDFMSDALEDGRKVRLLNIMDDYNRQVLLNKAGISFPAQRVTRELDQLIEYYGIPEQIRTDNGPEFTSNEFKMWCEQKGVKHMAIQPGKPNQNGFIERLNRTFREDVLDAYLFDSIEQMNVMAERWMHQYNHEHPHQSLQGMTPMTFKYSRRKIIDAFEKVKAKMNGLESGSEVNDKPALTFSSPSMARRLTNISME